MGKKSKQKGGEFEREVSKKLSLWLSKGERDDLLWRSSMSGGRATVQNKQGNENFSQAGDLSAIDRLGYDLTDKFTIEAKHYKDIYIGDIIWGLRTGDSIGTFWKQACQDAEKANKRPMLIAKQNFKEPILGLEWGIIEALNTETICVTYTETLPAALVRFDSFINNVNPEELIYNNEF